MTNYHGLAGDHHWNMQKALKMEINLNNGILNPFKENFSLKSRKRKRAIDGNYDMTQSISLLLDQFDFKMNGLRITTHSVTSFLSV